MVVSALLAVIALAVFSTFSSGVKLYQRTGQIGRSEEAVMFLERFSSDARNSFVFSGIAFNGTDKSLQMPAVVSLTGMPSAAGTVRSIGRVSYLYDPQQRTLARFQADYSQLYESGGGQARQVLEQVQQAEFSYYLKDAENKTDYWKNEFNPERGALPMAVRLDLEIQINGQPRRFVRTVSIPASAGAADYKDRENE